MKSALDTAAYVLEEWDTKRDSGRLEREERQGRKGVEAESEREAASEAALETALGLQNRMLLA